MKNNTQPKINTKILQKIRNPSLGKDYLIKIITDELTSICPYTNLPDFYKLIIIYKPNNYLIELKSLRDYLINFRGIKITHEELINKIYDDLYSFINPKYLKIILTVNVRGGLRVIIEREDSNETGDKNKKFLS